MLSTTGPRPLNHFRTQCTDRENDDVRESARPIFELPCGSRGEELHISCNMWAVLSNPRTCNERNQSELAAKLRHAGDHGSLENFSKLTWLVLGEDPAARSHRVEQFTAL